MSGSELHVVLFGINTAYIHRMMPEPLEGLYSEIYSLLHVFVLIPPLSPRQTHSLYHY